MRIILYILSAIVSINLCFAQQRVDSVLSNTKPRKIIVFSATSLVAGSSLVYLNQVWYNQYNTGKFHFFNDNKEWLQMDKYGHVYTNYQSSRMMVNAFKWAGFNKKQQLFIGGTLGLGYMTAIEIMDGCSSGWGFSWGDMLANTLGTTFSIGQFGLWNEQRIHIKFSYRKSEYAKYNPELLRTTNMEQILKDYNGQIYWLSVSPFSFVQSEKKLPKWIAFSFGYGADGMIGAESNSAFQKDMNGNPINFIRSRQYYISLDIDFSKIKTKSKVLRGVFYSLNLIKFPMPTLEFKNGHATFHPIYF